MLVMQLTVDLAVRRRLLVVHRIVAIRRRFVRRRLLLHLRRIGVLLHCNCAGNALAMRWMRWKFLLVLRHIWVLVLRRRFNTPHVICKCRIATPTSYSPASSPTALFVFHFLNLPQYCHILLLHCILCFCDLKLIFSV